MPNNLNEDTLAEQSAIDWLKELGFDYEYGPDISPGGLKAERDDFRDVVLVKRLRRALIKLNPDRNENEIEDAIQYLIRKEHPDPVVANKEIYNLIGKP